MAHISRDNSKELKTVEEVCEVLIDYRGKTPPKTTSGVRLLTAKVIKDGRIQDNNFEYIAEDYYDMWMRRGLPKKYDILLTTEAPLGEVAMLLSSEKIALAQRVILLRGNVNIISQKYLFHTMKSPFVQGELSSRASGTTVLGIKQSELRKVRIPKYPMVTQNKIASILSSYDDIIANNVRRIQLLDSMAKLIYDEWFVKFKFPGHELVKMVDSDYGEIPDGWEMKKLSELIEFKKGKQAKSLLEANVEGSFPYLLIDGIKTGVYQYTTEGVFVKRQDILMVMDGASSGVVFFGQQGYVGSTLAHIDLKEKSISSRYILLYLIANFDKISSNNTGAAIPHANKNFINGMDIVVPKKEERERLFSIFEKIFSIKSNLELRNINLVKTRDLLLPKLISGELDVSELDIKVSEVEV